MLGCISCGYGGGSGGKGGNIGGGSGGNARSPCTHVVLRAKKRTARSANGDHCRSPPAVASEAKQSKARQSQAEQSRAEQDWLPL